jgi:hypothetical protein
MIDNVQFLHEKAVMGAHGYPDDLLRQLSNFRANPRYDQVARPSLPPNTSVLQHPFVITDVTGPRAQLAGPLRARIDWVVSTANLSRIFI